MDYSGSSPGFSLLDDEIDREWQRQEAELDRFIELQGEQIREAIIEKVQANQLHTFTFAEQRILQKLCEKEAEVEDINWKNMELEERMKQLSVEDLMEIYPTVYHGQKYQMQGAGAGAGSGSSGARLKDPPHPPTDK